MRSDIHTYVQTHAHTTHTRTHTWIHTHHTHTYTKEREKNLHPSGAYLTRVALPALQWSTGSIDLYTTAYT